MIPALLSYRLRVAGLFLFPFLTFGQSGVVVSGSIRDESSGEALTGATIIVKDIPGLGAETNAYGFFSLTLPAGKHTFRLSFMGYASRDTAFTVNGNTRTLFTLLPETLSTEAVQIEAQAVENQENTLSPRMGITQLEVGDISRIPVLFGEQDVMKVVQLLPGIKSVSDGSTGFYVRGGSADQNLILLDEAPVYNPAHLLGFFSVFNSSALKDVTLIKGGMPAEYGGRLSGVMDIRMKEGNDKKFRMSGGIGLISSQIAAEGPLRKDKGSFMIAARRTYADQLLKLLPDSALNHLPFLSNLSADASLYFYDINAKANYRFGEKDQVFVSGYFGRDTYQLDDRYGLEWGNTTGTLRWNHLFSARLFSNTTFVYSNYTYQSQTQRGSIAQTLTAGIEDFNLKQDFQLYASGNHTFRFGVNAIRHAFIPGTITSEDSTEAASPSIPRKYALETAAYLSHEWAVTSRLKVNYGLRMSMFNATGNGGWVYDLDAEGNAVDSALYSQGQIYQTYTGLEPRMSLAWQPAEYQSIKASYMRTYQYLHLLSNTVSGAPTDLWIPSSNNVKPQRADQFSLGYFRTLEQKGIEASAEVYYKVLANQLDYRNNIRTEFATNTESELYYGGQGRAYGLELFVKKKYGRLNGWVSYTLSRTEQRFDAVNDGNWYAARQDRTHDVSVVGLYEASKRLSLSATWTYHTGDAVTFPSGKYLIDGQVVSLYTGRNSYRMPDYHRLDLGATLKGRSGPRFGDSWSFSLYNAYGRRNAYSITFRQSESDPTVTEAVRTSLFRWVPSVTYAFRF